MSMSTYEILVVIFLALTFLMAVIRLVYDMTTGRK
jgi:hypothetical protein